MDPLRRVNEFELASSEKGCSLGETLSSPSTWTHVMCDTLFHAALTTSLGYIASQAGKVAAQLLVSDPSLCLGQLAELPR